MEQQNYYFTFCGNSHYKNHFVKIQGTYAETRARMFEVFNNKWGFQYSEEGFKGQVEQFNLIELDLSKPKVKMICGHQAGDIGIEYMGTAIGRIIDEDNNTLVNHHSSTLGWLRCDLLSQIDINNYVVIDLIEED